MNIEILYIEGCPNYKPAVERVETSASPGRTAGRHGY
jgi:hypothetical protein